MPKIKDQPVNEYGRIYYTLGKILQDRGMTVKELAQRTQMNPVVLQKAIDGETWPSQWQLARVCYVLGLYPSMLIGYSPH